MRFQRRDKIVVFSAFWLSIVVNSMILSKLVTLRFMLTWFEHGMFIELELAWRKQPGKVRIDKIQILIAGSGQVWAAINQV